MASSLTLEVECVKQELDKKSLSLVSAQSELGTVSEVCQTTMVLLCLCLTLRQILHVGGIISDE